MPAIVAPRLGRARLPAYAATAALVLYTLWLRAGWGDRDLVNSVDDVAELVAAATAAIVCAAAAGRLHGRARWGWAAFAVGLTGWTAGELITCYDEVWVGRDVAFPGPADAGFLLLPAAALAALWLIAPQRAVGSRLRLMLDGLVIAASLLLVSFETAIGSALAAGGGPLSVALSLAYPVSDAAVAAVVILLLSRQDARTRPVMAPLAVGMLALTVSDSGYSYLVATGGYAQWQWLDAGWPVAFLLVAVAARRAVGAARRPAEAHPAVELDWGQLVLPYLPMALAAALVAGKLATGAALSRAGMSAGAGIVVLVLARQFLALADNRRLLAAVREGQDALRYQSLHDPLTGLGNRSLFLDRLDHAVELHRRDLRPVAVLFLDLDEFKQVNDTLGHGVGDALLVCVAERLRACLRAADTIARLGGDEFAVLLEDPLSDPAAVAERILAALTTPFVIDAHRLSVGASVGLAPAPAEAVAVQAADLLRQADLAMYAAKARGKNGVATYQPELERDREPRRVAT